MEQKNPLWMALPTSPRVLAVGTPTIVLTPEQYLFREVSTGGNQAACGFATTCHRQELPERRTRPGDNPYESLIWSAAIYRRFSPVPMGRVAHPW